MSRLQPATIRDVHRVRLACERLRDARDALAQAGAVRAAAKVRRALKSAEGALRHVERRQRTTERALAPGVRVRVDLDAADALAPVMNGQAGTVCTVRPDGMVALNLDQDGAALVQAGALVTV